MSPQLVIVNRESDFFQLPWLESESVFERQERMLIDNLPSIARKIEAQLEEMDNDSRETFEVQLLGIQIYADAATRGWDYRSIELIAVDIMNDDCEAFNHAAETLFNILADKVERLNKAMDKLYQERDYQ